MAVGLPIFIVLIGNPERTFMELLFTEEALEGSKHKFTTSLSLVTVGGSASGQRPVDLPPRMRTRRMYIRRMEVEKYGPTRGCPGCQKVMSGAVPLCIVGTHNDECRERMEKLMMQDPEGADRVVRTKTRINDALARHIEEHDERAKKIAKHDHHKASSGKNQASSSSSSGVVRSPEEQQRDSQDDAKMNEDDHGQIGGRIDPESNKEEKMSIGEQQESRRSEDDDRETKRQRLASVATSQPKPELMTSERFWDHVNVGELDAHVKCARRDKWRLTT